MKFPGYRQLGFEYTETHLLTHNIWCPDSQYQSNETGVSRLVDGVPDFDTFFLIQHGWHDWKLAGDIIKRLLTKGCDENRINQVMTFIKDR